MLFDGDISRGGPSTIVSIRTDGWKLVVLDTKFANERQTYYPRLWIPAWPYQQS